MLGRTNGGGSHSVVASPSTKLEQPYSSRQSVLVQGGQGLFDAAKRAVASGVSHNSDSVQRNHALRQSANSQIVERGVKYSYHTPKPSAQGNKVGEYMTREARLEASRQVKASHFQLGYSNNASLVDNKRNDDEVTKQKWNPQAIVVKKDLATSHFSLSVSTNNKFDGMSQARNDYQNRGHTYDPSSKAKRLALVNELRKSNLPTQNYDIPVSTAQESFPQSKSKADDLQAIKERKEDFEKIFARVRPAKPNFSLGGFKQDYMTENKRMKQPTGYSYDKDSIKDAVATQRKHNFSMSFEQGSQFETSKGAQGATDPYKIPLSNAKKDQVAKLGTSNLHQVQIGNSRTKSDYKSLTAIQQSGHSQQANGTASRNKGASYTEVRDKIAAQTKDLRSSHFALGADNRPVQPSSAAMFTAPSAKAIAASNSSENKMARDKIQRSNFSIKDAHGVKPATTQNQANNQIRQGQWDNGQISYSGQAAKPIDSINFGQDRQYITEAKETFVGKEMRGMKTPGSSSLKDKYMRNNINLGTSPNKESMMTVTQANERNTVNRNGIQTNQSSTDQKAHLKAFSTQQRSANFKLGSIQSEQNSYKPSQLERINAGQTIGLNININNRGSFKPVTRSNIPMNPKSVSAGNNIAMGQGSFRTVNQEKTNWIQPQVAALK